MEDFSITTRLTVKEYAKAIAIGFYKNIKVILSTILGIYLLVTAILDHFNIIDFYPDTPYFEFYSGLFILLAPALIVAISVRQFISNPSFQNDIKYTFGEKGIAVEGATFRGDFLWAHIIK